MEVQRVGQGGRQPGAFRGPSSGHYEHSEVSYSHSGRSGTRGSAGNQQSLAGSCAGAGFGILLLLGATVLLWMNEGVAVRTARSLDEASASMWKFGDITDAPIGSLVHTSGMLKTPSKLEDEDFDLQTSGLSLKRIPEATDSSIVGSNAHLVERTS